MARPTGRPVREELIVEATALIKAVGVSAFSYGDLAQRLGIKAPSIHHRFRAKQDLVAAVAERYRHDFKQAVLALEPASPADRLAAYANLFVATARADELCLCGAVAAEWLSIGDGSRQEVAAFFDDQVVWLTNELAAGQQAGSFRADLEAAQLAEVVLAVLEGALLMSRAGARSDLAAELCSVVSALAEVA